MTEAEYIKENFPFMTSIVHNDNRYVCIIQNIDEKFVSFYDVGEIPKEFLGDFIEMGNIWWDESNRKIPINIFLKDDMTKYRHFIKTIPLKNTEFEFGPMVSLSDLITKRVKRKQIPLNRQTKLRTRR